MIGNGTLAGVQLYSGGQIDSTTPPLRIFNIPSNTTSTPLITLSDNSFVNCQARCVEIVKSSSVSMTNNVFYNVYVIGIQVSQVNEVSIDDNLMIGVSDRPSVMIGSELVACFYVM